MLYTHSISTTRLALGTKSLPQHLSRAFLAAGPALTVTHRRSAGLQQQNFSTTRQHRLKEFFPQADAPSIHITKPAWPHPVYTEEQMKQIEVAHREARTFGDRMALGLVRLLRWGLDIATGYKHDHGKPQMKNGKAVFAMDERKYLIRNVFLESVAGVPGMVGGMLRHLHSLRKLKRDNGWIETLLEESYNERMHLLIFMKLAEPGWFMRLMVLGTQGVFFNSMFIAYLLNPRICHRFVGYLEEEAVLTYSRQIEEIENGKLPHWADPSFKAPDIAVNYYNMPEGKRTMKDLLLHIRADEAKHREVNTTLGNLDQNNDPNPFVSEYKDKSKPHPTKSLKNLRSTGWEREEVIGRAN